MIAALDVRTLILVAGTMYLLLPLSVWLVLRMPRERAPVMWCVGGLLGGLGLWLIGLRGRLPDELTYLVGNPMLVLGAIVVAQSLRLLLGRPWPWRWIALGLAAYAVMLWLVLPTARWDVMGVLIRAANLVAVLALALSAWQVGRAEGSRNAMTIAAAYVLQSIAVTTNLVSALRGSTNIHTMAGSAAFAATMLLTLLVAVIAAMGYLGLALERSTRRRVELAQELSRAQQWRDRREALVRLDRERMLSVLADSLGHEITQPLTAALLRLQTAQHQLGQGPLDPQRQQRWLEQVIHNIRRAGETVGRIRQLVRPQPMEHALVDMAQVLRRLQGLLRQEAINRRIRLRFHLGPQALTMGDALLLSQALLQVLRNAMAAVASAPQAEVHVMLEARAGQVLVQVIDSGPGLPEAALQRHGGAPQSLQGIGLFVAESILQRHHGDLVLENRAGGGAVVTLVLPRYTAASLPDETLPLAA